MSSASPPSAWPLHRAKAAFSAVVRQAQTDGPQQVLVHGRPAAIVLSVADYERLTAQPAAPDLHAFLSASPLRDLDFGTPAERSPVRDVDL